MAGWLAVLPLIAATLAVPPSPAHRVSDYVHALTPDERDRLDQKLADLERAGAAPARLAIFSVLEGESLEDFSRRLAAAWQRARPDLARTGVLVVVIADDRRVRIEAGAGLRDRLPEAVAASIVRHVMRPRFREPDFVGALESGIEAVGFAIAGPGWVPPPSPEARFSPGQRAFILLAAVLLGAFDVRLLGALIGVARARRGARPPSGGPAAVRPSARRGPGEVSRRPEWRSTNASSRRDRGLATAALVLLIFLAVPWRLAQRGWETYALGALLVEAGLAGVVILGLAVAGRGAVRSPWTPAEPPGRPPG